MKILHLVTQMEAGGAQGAAIRNSSHMRLKGIDSRVCFFYIKRGVYKDCQKVYYLNSKKPSGLISYVSIFLRLLAFIYKEKPDAVICYTHYANVMGGIAGRLVGVKKVVASHRNPSETYPALCRKVDRLWGIIGVYDVAIAVSKTVADSFLHYPRAYKRRLRMIRNGVDIDAIKSQVIEHEYLRYLDSLINNRPCFKFVTTGRLHHQKNQKILFEAIKDVEGAALFIAGDGELLEDYKKEIEKLGVNEKVFLLGEVDSVKVKTLLSWGDAFVFPSAYEAFGFSVVEAMVVGLPILCSNIKAMEEIVGEAGVLVDPNSPTEWKVSMTKLLNSTEYVEKLSVNSLERSKEFDIENMVDGYIEASL